MTPGGPAGAGPTWDRLADSYDRQEHREARAIATVLRLAAPTEEDRVVDLATGTGLVLRRMAALPEPPRTAVGVDRSTAMLGRTGGLPTGWRTLRGDARDVPLPDGCADLVTCTYALHLMEGADRRAVLREARRLLGPGIAARLVLATVWCDPRTPGGRLADPVLRGLAHLRPEAWGGLRPLDPTPDLAAAGLRATHRAVVRRGGYPTLVVRAEPA